MKISFIEFGRLVFAIIIYKTKNTSSLNRENFSFLNIAFEESLKEFKISAKAPINGIIICKKFL